MVRRILVFIVFLPVAMLAAGVFGAVHDQISYTVAPEYYTRFKFIQFHLLDSPLPERIRASIVGVRASWWMGLPLGVLVGLAGFAQRSPREMARALLWSLPLACTIVLAAALVGLVYGWYATGQSINMADYAGFYRPANLKDPRAFLCAGFMHNAAYLGGAIAVPMLWLFLAVWRWRTQAPRQLPH
jgi:hypothetical protein